MLASREPRQLLASSFEALSSLYVHQIVAFQVSGNGLSQQENAQESPDQRTARIVQIVRVMRARRSPHDIETARLLVVPAPRPARVTHLSFT